MKRWEKWLIPSVVSVLVPGISYAAQYLSLEQAQQILFSQAKRFEGSHILFTQEQVQQIEKKAQVVVSTKGQQVWKAYDNERFLGFFIVDYVIGKHELIDYAVALEPDGKVKGVEIMSYRESYGGEIRNTHWREQFIGKNPKSLPVLNHNIANIGGATLSCRHVTEGIKKILTVYEIALIS